MRYGAGDLTVPFTRKKGSRCDQGIDWALSRVSRGGRYALFPSQMHALRSPAYGATHPPIHFRPRHFPFDASKVAAASPLLKQRIVIYWESDLLILAIYII